MKNKLLKSLKKITSYVIALSMIALSFPLIPTAQAAGTPTVAIVSQVASIGDTVNVPISATNFANTIGSIDFKVSYNADLLTYTGLTQNDISGHGTLLSSDVTVNPIVINWTSPSALDIDNGTILTLSFTVISATPTSTNLTFSNTELGTISDPISPTSFVNGVISLNPVQATPTFSPVAGAVAWGTAVIITSAGADAIYYTTDGTNPATSVTGTTLAYSAPITISANTTIKTIAVKAGYADSAIGSAAYTQAAATAPSSVVLAAGSTAAVGGVTNVTIPAAGGTDTTGTITSWITGTNDKIKFTVTDNGGASAITINSVGYTSGADYTIAAASTLTIVVTTTETGKATGVRTFIVSVTAAADAMALNDAITAANALHDGATEGTTVGKYTVGSKATFNTAIDAAEVIYAAKLLKTQEEINTAVSNLATADGIFDAALITEASLVVEYTNAANAAAFVTLLNANNLELTLTDYAGLDAMGKTAVGTEMLGVNTFTDKAAVQSAVTTAITNAKPASDGRIADIAAVASAKTAITGGTYTNLEVVNLVQATKTAAVQVVVDSLKDTTTAVVTFATPNYSVAISKGAASDTYIITTATFTLISKSALITAITSATTNKDSVATSADGTDVKSSNQWVTSGVKATYAAAIATAQTVVDNESASQGQADGAVTTLAGATSIFNAAKANGSDDIAPTVTKIGNDSADVTIASSTDATLTFSETLSTTGKTAVQTALTNGADKTITYSWDASSTILTITGHATDVATFANDVSANVTDIAGNSAILLLIDSKLAEDQIAPDESGDVTVSTTTPEVVITNPTQAVDVTIGSEIENPTIDVSSFIGSNGTGTLPAINITSANANNTTVAIPASTTVTSADATWDGVIAAPTVTTVTIPATSGQTKTFSTAIQVGFTGAKLSFDKAVKILLPGQADKRAGYIRTGIDFTEITTACGVDSQTWADANLGTDGDCKINSGSDLVIWTKHFTSFATYTQTTNNTGGGGGGGYVPATSCSSVIYGEWGTCVNGIQYRNVLSQSPLYCSLTVDQQLTRSKSCGITSLNDPVYINQASSTQTINVTAEEKELTKKIDSTLIKRLAGRILLQVERFGQAWYLDVVSLSRYYLADGATAYEALRKFGLGIKNVDLDKIPVALNSALPDNYSTSTEPVSSALVNRLKGRIVLQVENHGEAWYINPTNGQRYYLANGEVAYQIMRNLSLGISDINIHKITVGSWE